jgi:hypothetical protein
MRIVARSVIFLAALSLVAVAALNLAYFLRIRDVFQWGTLFGVFQIVVAVLAAAFAIGRASLVRYMAIGGAAVIAIERLWTVASRSYTDWTISDWTFFITIVLIPPFAILGASLLIPDGRRKTGTVHIDAQEHT